MIDPTTHKYRFALRINMRLQSTIIRAIMWAGTIDNTQITRLAGVLLRHTK
jgi:hypothetical protein